MGLRALPVSLGAVRSLLGELQASTHAQKPLVVGGARELAGMLARELAAGGDSAAVRIGDPDGAAVYVHIQGATDEADLRRARRARVPIVAVASGADGGSIPYVLETDVVRLAGGERFPIARIAAVIAARLGEDAAPLAARLPSLRGPVCEQIVESFARKNGIVGAAVFVPGADLPVLALNQARMLLRLDQAYGLEIDPRERLPEIVATVAAGLGMRAIARELVDLLPAAGWLVKGGVAYGGTKALGEAAIRLLESGYTGAPAPS